MSCASAELLNGNAVSWNSCVICLIYGRSEVMFRDCLPAMASWVRICIREAAPRILALTSSKACWEDDIEDGILSTSLDAMASVAGTTIAEGSDIPMLLVWEVLGIVLGDVVVFPVSSRGSTIPPRSLINRSCMDGLHPIARRLRHSNG